jgi:mannobiose 2-epimerase
MARFAPLLLILACSCSAPPKPTAAPAPPILSAAPPPADAPRYERAEYEALANELEGELSSRVLAFWFPKVVDEKAGGFLQSVNADGAPVDDGSKFLVFQARMTWVAAEVAARNPELLPEYLGYAEHGLGFLERSLWDAEAGGLYWELDAKGKPTTTEKHAYGIAFGIYAAATVARAANSDAARDFALKIYEWLDGHAHDARHGGYYEALTREGKPILSAPQAQPNDGIGTAYGRKSMNSHLHLLEALTELYRVAPSDALKARLTEIFQLVRDRISDEAGFFHLYFSPDWKKFASADSYGHNVEGAFLLLEAASVLGMPRDDKTLKVARKLVDRALERGWDEQHGGFYNEGEPKGKAKDFRKVWWVQAEGLNGLLALHELYGAETRRYFDAFTRQWSFIETHVSDSRSGEWWGYLGPKGELSDPKQDKGGKWKACYHNARALMVSVEKLRRLAARAP